MTLDINRPDLIVGIVGTGAAYAASYVGTARNTISSIFGNSGPSLPASDGYYNILLLGADSGEGRDSMRFDSISVVSVNAETGAVTITGIPRDMPNFPFAEDSPMRDPDLVGFDYRNYFEGHTDSQCGWGPGINQLTNAVQTRIRTRRRMLAIVRDTARCNRHFIHGRLHRTRDTTSPDTYQSRCHASATAIDASRPRFSASSRM